MLANTLPRGPLRLGPWLPLPLPLPARLIRSSSSPPPTVTFARLPMSSLPPRVHTHTAQHRAAAAMSNYYGRPTYWDERYTKDPDPFDWYQRYAGLKGLIAQFVKPSDRVLMAGCGNSRLSEEMHADGYQRIDNVDISGVVINQMAELHRDKPGMTWRQMNVCSLDFADGSFEAVLDKGTMDSILCGEGSVSNVANFCMEVSRVLKPQGVFVVISYGVPENRMQYLEEETYNWSVEIHTVSKPQVSSVPQPADPSDSDSVHYVYVCRKRDGSPGPAPTAKAAATSAAPISSNEAEAAEGIAAAAAAAEEGAKEEGEGEGATAGGGGEAM